MARRELPEINAGSMADIAFLLLIFFLVTTTMDTDIGMIRKLSPVLPDGQEPPEVHERDVFVVLVNRNDQLFVEGDVLEINQLRKKTKLFILNPDNSDNLPEKKIVNINGLGNIEVTKGVISFKADRGTSYKKFVAVLNELTAAVNDVKNENSMKYFGKKYADLSEEQEDAIKKSVPVVISEAEPNIVGLN